MGDTTIMFENLKQSGDAIDLLIKNDRVSWSLGAKGFSVNSVYKQLINDSIKVSFRFMWKSKTPQKNKKNFLWLVFKNEILSKTNLRKRGWVGSSSCFLWDR